MEGLGNSDPSPFFLSKAFHKTRAAPVLNVPRVYYHEAGLWVLLVEASFFASRRIQRHDEHGL